MSKFTSFLKSAPMLLVAAAGLMTVAAPIVASLVPIAYAAGATRLLLTGAAWAVAAAKIAKLINEALNAPVPANNPQPPAPVA